MTIADDLYKEAVLEIQEKGSWDKDSSSIVRTVYEDGESAYSKGIFGKQFTFKQGEIPILTSKKVFWKTALKEMMLFWQHQTVLEKDFKEHKVKVWDEWFKDGNLGKSYAYQFESTPELKVEHINKVFTTNELIHLKKESTPLRNDETVITLESPYEIVIEGKSYTIVSEIQDIGGVANNLSKNSYYISSNSDIFIKEDEEYTYVGKDTYQNNIVDYAMYHSELKETDYEKIHSLWQELIKEEQEGLITLADRWKVFDYFFEDIYYMPQFFLARKDNFKDWKLTNQYHNVISSREDKIISRENSLFLNEKQVFILNDCRNNLLVPIISKNQVVDLLKTMKNFPNSRRLLTSFWNDEDVPYKVLQECAWSTNWRIRNSTIDLILIQRSGDIALGIPFNSIQYYLLQNMIAKSLNLEVGAFTHQIGDLHYYDRHEEVLVEQVTHDETFEQPTLSITPRDFFDYSFSDIKLENYTSGKVYKYEVAI